eukprot:4530341-Prymnesium_polylepis.1
MQVAAAAGGALFCPERLRCRTSRRRRSESGAGVDRTGQDGCCVLGRRWLSAPDTVSGARLLRRFWRQTGCAAGWCIGCRSRIRQKQFIAPG